ncbi:MAG TPA: GntR family transcriptional regulator [Conexibacter sp.]|nr:GntR family transcriptional regulator [Conexibacter sp.]
MKATIEGISRPVAAGGGGQHAQKLARSLFSGQIAGSLREAIIGGTLQAGTPLVELQLAKQMEVSRGPVRSALHALEGEGLVRTRPNGRMVVAGFGPDDLRDLFAVRLLIESTAMRWAAREEYDPAEVLACFEAMRAEGTSTPTLVDLDIRFHEALVALSGSRFLKQSWLALAPVLHAVIALGNRELTARDPKQNFERIIGSHEAIVAPLVARDVEGIVAKLTEQFELAGSLLSVGSADGR